MSEPLISASALNRCGWARVLKRQRPRSASTVAAADRGTLYHAMKHAWVTGQEIPRTDDLEVAGWLALLQETWTPPVGGEYEIALGLGPEADYVEVDEVLPHVYAPKAGLKVPLLTAGRADNVWLADRVLYVVDDKTGLWQVEDPRTNLQLWSLMLAALGRELARGRQVRWMRPGVYYARDGVFDWGDAVAVGSPTHEERWQDVLAAATVGEHPRPGSNCIGCWERKACEHAQEAA